MVESGSIYMKGRVGAVLIFCSLFVSPVFAQAPSQQTQVQDTQVQDTQGQDTQGQDREAQAQGRQASTQKRPGERCWITDGREVCKPINIAPIIWYLLMGDDPNQPPVAQPPAGGDVEVAGVATPITLAGSDAEGNPLIYEIVTPPTKGVLMGTLPDVIYTPNAGASGTDSFTFRVFDGVLYSDPVTVNLYLLPSVSITDAAINEGDSGTQTLQFTVSVSEHVNPLSVEWATSDGSATTADNDYVAASGTLNFAGGVSSQTIDVTVNGDEALEPNETFTITLSNPVNALVDALATSATGTINNDDWQLNDTGIDWSGSYSSGNNSSCTDAIIHSTDGTVIPQDCNQGRDAQAAAGTLVKVGGGHAGFDFTRLNADGSDYTGGGDYASEPWRCVRDNTTGLVWEVKTDDGGIHDKDIQYRWGGETAQGSGFGTEYYSDWNALVNGSNTENAGAGLCGYTDWRVPTTHELQGIVSYDRVNPAIDTAYFPNTKSFYYWSASPYAYDSGDAWGVVFYDGLANFNGRSLNFHVRLVRGGQ